ncbi:MAG: FAD-binding oxidoreductase [Methyloglobulus sp.]|nr:FAD-binding oxidoreductase [Methyloglobulus sp.]
MKTDFLIVGQGLAGSLLAWELLRRDCKVVVVDNGKDNASLIAAGIINPITGKRFVKTAEADTLLPTAQLFYDQLAAFFKKVFYCKKPMLRIFGNHSELNHCLLRQQQVEYLPYLGQVNMSNSAIVGFPTRFGVMEQKQTGHLLTIPLLEQLKKFFMGMNCYRQSVVDYQSVELGATLRWQDITAKKLIFCEGYYGSQNPWFSGLPFRLAKGEILTFAHTLALPDAMLNYGNWLLPVNSHTIRMGATFDREFIDTLPSEGGKDILLRNLELSGSELAQATVINHHAGVRPCTLDKYPFLGTHPQDSRIAIFNGFGAKGSLQIPWYCQRFADYLLNQIPLPSACDIQRF